MRVLLVVAGLALAGCTGAGTGAGGGGGTPTFGDFCAQFRTALADRLSTCQSGPKDLWADALTFLSCDDLQKAVTAGRATYDGASAQACLSSVSTLTCSSIFKGGTSGDCQKTLKGAVASGGKCYAETDCGEGSFCSKTSGACDGTCKAKLAASAACTFADSCIDGYSCVNSVCTIDPADGMVEVGGSCTGSSRCKTGLVCDSVTKNCANYVKEGATCEFGHNTCELFTSCGSANKCVRSEKAGGACGTTVMGTLYENAGCVSAYCKMPTGSSTGTCTARGAIDAMCTNGDECLSGKCTSGKCVAGCVVP